MCVWRSCIIEACTHRRCSIAALLITIPLQQYSWADSHEGELITGMIFLAGGLAFFIYYVIVSKQEAKESA